VLRLIVDGLKYDDKTRRFLLSPGGVIAARGERWALVDLIRRTVELSVYSHLSLRPHLAYDVSNGLERLPPMTSDIPTSSGLGLSEDHITDTESSWADGSSLLGRFSQTTAYMT